MKKTKVGYNVSDTARQAALEALKEFRNDEREKTRRRSFHNMKALMENYLELVEHYEKIKYRAKDLDDYLENMDIFDVDPESEDGEIRIEAIKRSKTRTLIMITQIQAAVGMLKREMEIRDEIEKYLTMTALYMDQKKRGMKFNNSIFVNSKSIERWRRKAMSLKQN
jgi:hypothetical protein